MVRIAVVAVVFAVLGIGAYHVYYHPPMRLMPPPLLVLSSEGKDLYTRSTLSDGTRSELFFATNRFPVWRDDNRIYTVVPDTRLHVGMAELEIDAEGSTIEQMVEWTRDTGGEDRPYIRLQKMSEYGVLGWNLTSGAENWLAKLNETLLGFDNRSIMVYVHGANTTVERAAGQASQMAHFSGGNAVIVLFTWPTAENFLKYPSDIRNALGSAPKLVELIGIISDRTTAKTINLFSYSAGATVASQALSLMVQQHPDLLENIGEVYFAAPDVDFADFVDDLGGYVSHVHRVTAAVNLGDSALRLAKVINRASRAGRPDLQELSPEARTTLMNAATDHGLETVHVDPGVLPGSTSTTHTFWYDDPWVSSDVLAALLFKLAPDQRGLASGTTDAGNEFWYFPQDYPGNLLKLRATLVEQLK